MLQNIWTIANYIYFGLSNTLEENCEIKCLVKAYVVDRYCEPFQCQNLASEEISKLSHLISLWQSQVTRDEKDIKMVRCLTPSEKQHKMDQAKSRDMVTVEAHQGR